MMEAVRWVLCFKLKVVAAALVDTVAGTGVDTAAAAILVPKAAAHREVATERPMHIAALLEVRTSLIRALAVRCRLSVTVAAMLHRFQPPQGQMQMVVR